MPNENGNGQFWLLPWILHNEFCIFSSVLASSQLNVLPGYSSVPNKPRPHPRGGGIIFGDVTTEMFRTSFFRNTKF